MSIEEQILMTEQYTDLSSRDESDSTTIQIRMMDDEDRKPIFETGETFK